MTPDGTATPTSEPTSLAGLLRALRARALLSQEQLAERSGVSVRTIRDLETGHILLPRGGTVRLLADALELTEAERVALAANARRGPDGPAAAAEPTLPAQLPADPPGFIGRVRCLRELDELLPGGEGTAASTVVISAIAGAAGVGKTALAVHWAHRVRERFPDGQLYVNLRGFDPGGSVMHPAEAVRGFLAALGVAPERVPVSLDGQVGLYRSLLAGKRVLVVLDNARDAGQVRPLLPASPGCLGVVTSRNQLSGLVTTDGARPLTLDVLTAEEARELLCRRLGADRIAAEPRAVDDIIEACARLPLALAIVAARAIVTPSFPLATVAGQLREPHGGLDAFAGEDPATDVRAVLSWSYRAISPGAGWLFRLLGLHPGPDATVPAAASLAGLSEALVRPLLAELVRASLLAERTPGRYAFHDLLRAYAIELAEAHETEAERRAAQHRMLDHYLHSAYAAALLLHPHRDPITPTEPQPGAVVADLADHEAALTWFTGEHGVLLTAVERAAAARFDAHAWQLAWTLAEYFDRQGHWHDWVVALRTALEATRRLVDPAAQAYAHGTLARASVRLGRYDDAHADFSRALALLEGLGDHIGQAHTQRNLGRLREEQGRYQEAIDHGQRALDLYRAAGHHAGQARALNQIGWYHALLGDHTRTLSYCQQALALQEDIDDRYGAAATWDSLGYAHHHLGHHAQATACYREALDRYREFGDRYNGAEALTHLGDTHHAAGELEAARTLWHEALDILSDLGHPDAEKLSRRLREGHGRPVTQRG